MRLAEAEGELLAGVSKAILGGDLGLTHQAGLISTLLLRIAARTMHRRERPRPETALEWP